MINNLMPPPWMMYPEIHQYSIGWRMGYGESYVMKWSTWLATLSEDEQDCYEEMFPHPKTWRNYYHPDFDMDSDDDFICETVEFWNKEGEMAYSREKLIQQITEGSQNVGYVFFWKPDLAVVDQSCLGQWQPSRFEMEEEYTCAEQYMMAEKARLFGDGEICEQILKSADPKEMKALGKKVRNFQQALWDKVKYSIVLNANYYKFSQNKEMRDFLLSTGNKVLVEASPLDTIWGIGLSESNEKASDPKNWRGHNLLGFALMEVRDEIRNVYKSHDKIDWPRFKS